MINIASVLAANQPGILVTLINQRLLSVVALRDMLGMASAKDHDGYTKQLMGHDAYRRAKGRVTQTQWSA